MADEAATVARACDKVRAGLRLSTGEQRAVMRAALVRVEEMKEEKEEEKKEEERHKKKVRRSIYAQIVHIDTNRYTSIAVRANDIARAGEHQAEAQRGNGRREEEEGRGGGGEGRSGGEGGWKEAEEEGTYLPVYSNPGQQCYPAILTCSITIED